MDDVSPLNLDELPDWLKNSMSSVFVSPRPQSVLAYRESPAWKLLVEAAVVGPFLPRDLAATVCAESARPHAERAVLDFSRMIQTPEGPQWTLVEDARQQVLNVAIGTGEADLAIDRTETRFLDDLSRSLRRLLKKQDFDWTAVEPRLLESGRIAANLLSGVVGLNVPPVESIESEIVFRRIMAPFESMVGPMDHERHEPRLFFGRQEELEDLREYVGVISSTNILHFVARAKKFATRKLLGWRPFSLWGVGGAGKSTLIARFMVEHARVAQARFPFAYLDFDRPTISARNLPGLLAEMCIQTGSQFPELLPVMTALRTELRNRVSSGVIGEEVESLSYLNHFLAEFRRRIDDFLRTQGSYVELERPFLLVFDTFELVQYSEDDVLGLERFVQGLGAPHWSRLRLVIAGRQKVDRFLGEPQQNEIGPLDSASSAKVILQSAADAGKPVTSADASRLVRAIARVTRDKGVHPLRLRLVGQQFENRNDGPDGTAIVKSLLRDLENPNNPVGLAGQSFLDGILIRRIATHIADPRVRALAIPGLVVRRITPEVIQQVMATSVVQSPNVGSDNRSPTVIADQIAPQDGNRAREKDTTWIIDDHEAREIFAAFRREVSLVETVDDQTLRHREDVRRQMIPSMRASESFTALNKVAYDYYRRRVHADPADFASAEEAVYHGLWIGIPLTELNALWPTAITPRIDPTQFDKGSDSSLFVTAKLHNALSLEDVSRLPPEIALEWLDARSADLLKDRNIQGSIDFLRSALKGHESLLENRSSMVATLACLLYRAGLWEDAVSLCWHHLQSAGQDDFADQQPFLRSTQSSPRVSLLRTLATVIARGFPDDPRRKWIEAQAQRVADPVARTEILAHCLLAHACLREEADNSSSHSLREAAAEVSRKQWKSDLFVLRLAAAAGNRQPELIETWIEFSKQLPRIPDLDDLESLFQKIVPDAFPAATSRSSFSIFSSSSVESWNDRFNRLDDLWRSAKSALLSAWRDRPELRPVLRRIAVADFSDWIRPVGNSLTRALESPSGEKLITLLRKQGFASSRARKGEDGVGIAQAAHDDGRFWEFVEFLRELPASMTRPAGLSELIERMFVWREAIHDQFNSDLNGEESRS